jgi:Protein of unknown function (DUF4239)
MALVDYPQVLFFVLFLVLAAFVEIGLRFGRVKSAHQIEGIPEVERSRDELGILLSLLLGFTLAMVLTRFDLRKQLVVDEADAIETTSLRAGMLPEPISSKAKDLLRQYLDARLEFSKAGLNKENAQAALTRAKQLQRELWQESKAATQQSPTPITGLFVQSLNEVIVLDDKRLAAAENRVPGEVWLMLISLSFLLCMLVGYCQRRRLLLTLFVTPLVISIVITLVADLDAPGSGLIQVGHKSLERVRADLNENSPNQ